MEQQPNQPLNTPEEGERLRINALVIPADETQPLRADQIDPTSLTQYRQFVGGNLEAINLNDPPASLYLNEEGKLEDLPVNRRATLLLWLHNPDLRFRDHIAGDALLTGIPDDEGHDTDVPSLFPQTLLQVSRFRAEIKTEKNPDWHSGDVRFADWTHAYAEVLEVAHLWPQVTDIRVLPDE